MLKYKGSWPSLSYHSVIFVYICQKVMKCVWTEFILILNKGEWAAAQIQELLFQLCTSIYYWASKESSKLFKNQWRIITCR